MHKQFGHPSAVRLNTMIDNAGVKDKVLKKKVIKATENCDSCVKFKKPPPKPVVSVPLASHFNEGIAMSLKSFEKKNLSYCLSIH